MEHWNEAKIKDLAEVKGGKRLPKGKQLIKEPNNHPYIRIRDLGKAKYLQLNSEYEYVDDETQKTIGNKGHQGVINANHAKREKFLKIFHRIHNCKKTFLL